MINDPFHNNFEYLVCEIQIDLLLLWQIINFKQHNICLGRF